MTNPHENPEYWINNPSAWDSFDQGASDVIERLVDQNKQLKKIAETIGIAFEQITTADDDPICCDGSNCTCFGVTEHEFARFRIESAYKTLKAMS